MTLALLLMLFGMLFCFLSAGLSMLPAGTLAEAMPTLAATLRFIPCLAVILLLSGALAFMRARRRQGM